jgi:hypothetical protein
MATQCQGFRGERRCSNAAKKGTLLCGSHDGTRIANGAKAPDLSVPVWSPLTRRRYEQERLDAELVLARRIAKQPIVRRHLSGDDIGTSSTLKGGAITISLYDMPFWQMEPIATMGATAY